MRTPACAGALLALTATVALTGCGTDAQEYPWGKPPPPPPGSTVAAEGSERRTMWNVMNETWADQTGADPTLQVTWCSAWEEQPWETTQIFLADHQAQGGLLEDVITRQADLIPALFERWCLRA